MNARGHTSPFRLVLEIFLVLAFVLILTTGAILAQARTDLSTPDPAPVGYDGAEIQASTDASIQAALMAAEMAALTPPFYMVDLPLVQR